MAKKKKIKKRGKQKGKNPSKRTSFAKRIRNVLFRFLDLLKKLVSNLPGQLKRYVLAATMFLLSIISFLSFFGSSGKGGEFLKGVLLDLIGDACYIIPFIFILWGLTFLIVAKRFIFAGFLAGIIFTLGVAGAFALLDSIFVSGGKIGSVFSGFFRAIFGDLVAASIFFTFAVLGSLAFWHLFQAYFSAKEDKETVISRVIRGIKAIPKFTVSEIEPEPSVNKEEKVEESVKKPETKKAKLFKFTPPPLEFLEQEGEKAHAGNIKENAQIIKRTLENFGIEVSMGHVNVGPTVTQYTLKPAEGVKLSKITGLANNLALDLAAHPIRIEAPIPGKPLVGIEIPNKVRSKVRLRNLIDSDEFKSSTSSLTFTLGRDVSDDSVFADLARLPHLLVAGATGTGKTIFLNSLILSFLYQNSPEILRFVLIDPKRVEFHLYNGLPHLLCPVIFDPERAVNALKWLIEEMERRFSLLSEAGVKDIANFNQQAIKQEKDLLPWIVLIIDELADLMAAKGKEIEGCIIRIAQMARAVGIHLIVATQRPSVEVITGLIKANITSRISFQVATQFDARTVIDMAGAEKLLGLGDMLFISADRVKPKRIQGAFVSEHEVRKVVEWLKENAISADLEQNELFRSLQEFREKEAMGMGSDALAFKDQLYEQAKEAVIMAKRGSASLLQRRLQIGYARAARLLDMLEAEGVIGPSRGAKPREVYFRPEDEEIFE